MLGSFKYGNFLLEKRPPHCPVMAGIVRLANPATSRQTGSIMNALRSPPGLRAVAVLIVFCAQTVEGQWSRSIKDLPPPPPESSATPGSLPAAEFGVPFGLDDSKRQSWNPLQRDLLFAELEKELLAKHYDKLIDLVISLSSRRVGDGQPSFCGFAGKLTQGRMNGSWL